MKSDTQADVWSAMQDFKFYFILLFFKASSSPYSQVESQLKMLIEPWKVQRLLSVCLWLYSDLDLILYTSKTELMQFTCFFISFFFFHFLFEVLYFFWIKLCSNFDFQIYRCFLETPGWSKPLLLSPSRVYCYTKSGRKLMLTSAKRIS